jgi:Tfp pilus assembly protein PilZ
MINNDALRTPEVKIVLDRKPQYLIKWGTLFVIIFFIVGCIISSNVIIAAEDAFSAKYLSEIQRFNETKNLKLTFIINTNNKPLAIGDKVTMSLLTQNPGEDVRVAGNVYQIDSDKASMREAKLKFNLESKEEANLLIRKIGKSDKITIGVARSGKSDFKLFWQNI